VLLGDGVPLKQGRQIWVPLKRRYFVLLALTVWKWLQIDTKLLHIITSTDDVLFRFVNIDDLERPWTPKRKVLVKFWQFLAAAHISTVNCDKMAGDRPNNLHVKFSALNVDFSCPSPDPLSSRRTAQLGVKYGYPLKSGYFTALAW